VPTVPESLSSTKVSTLRATAMTTKPPATATSRSGRCPRTTVSMRTFSNQMRAANSNGVQALAANATARGNQDRFSSTTKRR